MTQPAAHGYPDWGRFEASSDKRYVSTTQLGLVAAFDSGPFFVGDVPYIAISSLVSGNGAELQVLWAMDQAGAQPTWLDSVEFSNAASCFITLPVRGPWVLLHYAPVATPYNVVLFMTSSRSPNTVLGNSAAANVLISQVNTPIGAGAAVQSIAARIIPGPAIWNVSSTAATWNAVARAFHDDLTLVRLDTTTNVAPNESRHLILPPMVGEITVTNTSGAAATFSCTLMAKPMYGGQ